MDSGYNLYNLEAPFENFLFSVNKEIRPISVRNYLSDLRHFLGWVILTMKNRRSEFHLNSTEPDNFFAEFLTIDIVNDYSDYLKANDIPVKTINRRFSTLRKFCAFCFAQGWIKVNLANQIVNLSSPSSKKREANKRQSSLSKLWIDHNDAVAEFSAHLSKHEEDENVAKAILNDVREFFVINSNQ